MFKKIKALIKGLHLFLFLVSQLIMVAIPFFKLLTTTEENTKAKYIVLAISAVVLFFFNLIVELRAAKQTKAERSFKKKFKKGAKIISNIASLVVLVLLWQSNADTKLLIPLVASIIVAICDSIYLLIGWIFYSIRHRSK